jgi:hypothetical protein
MVGLAFIGVVGVVGLVLWLVSIERTVRQLWARLEKVELKAHRIERSQLIMRAHLGDGPDTYTLHHMAGAFGDPPDNWEPKRLKWLEENFAALVDSLGLKGTLTKAVPSRRVFVPKGKKDAKSS